MRLDLHQQEYLLLETMLVGYLSKRHQLGGFHSNSNTLQHNLKLAHKNSTAAAQAQNFIVESTNWATRYKQIQDNYNSNGVRAYNEQHFTDALAVFTAVEKDCTQLLAALTDLETKYPSQQGFSSYRNAAQALLDAAIKLKEMTVSQVK